MIRSLNVWVAVCLVAVGPGLSSAFAAPTENPFDKFDPVDVSFAGTLARAQRGDAEAQTKVGVMYDFGQGVTQDFAAAVNWYRKAANQNNAQAQTLLGYMYLNGQGVAQDYTAAFSWFSKGAEQGSAQAQYALWRMHYLGRGVAKNYDAAAYWLDKSADQGLPKAVEDRAIELERLERETLRLKMELSNDLQQLRRNQEAAENRRYTERAASEAAQKRDSDLKRELNTLKNCIRDPSWC